MDLSINVNREVAEQFKVSFGAWNVLAQLLEPYELLELQALSRYTYDVSISRV